MKKLKNWNLFEILFLTISYLVILTCFIIFPEKNWLSLASSMIGIFAVVLVAKGFVFAPVVNLIYGILYIIISITQKYFGEAIIYGFLMTPMYIISIITWLKNKNSENSGVVNVNIIHGKEYIFLFVGTVIFSIVAYFILKLLNTSELIVSTFSITTSAMATYLMIRRSSYYALAFMIDDIISVVLWSMSIINFGIAYLPSVLCFCLFLINDIYGFIHWKKQENNCR